MPCSSLCPQYLTNLGVCILAWYRGLQLVFFFFLKPPHVNDSGIHCFKRKEDKLWKKASLNTDLYIYIF